MQPMEVRVTARSGGRPLLFAALILGATLANLAAAQAPTASEPSRGWSASEEDVGLTESSASGEVWRELPAGPLSDPAWEAPGAQAGSGRVAERTNGLALEGVVSGDWSTLGTRMQVPRISNTSSSLAGPLQLQLWATTDPPVSGQTIFHSTLGTYDLGYLAANSAWTNVDTGWIAHTPPTSGCYYLTVALLRLVSGTYYYEFLRTFDQGGADNGAGSDRFGFGSARCVGADGSVNQVVPSSSGGTATGLFVSPGDRVTISAWGRLNTWAPEPQNPVAGPEGNGQACNASCQVPSSQFGALVGRVGSGGPWFYVGRGGSFIADRSGALELAVNDHYYPDNIGDFTVTSKVDGGGGGPCVETATSMCLNRGRFRVEVSWRTTTGATGVGSVVPQHSSDSGLFWFFNSANWEMLIKILDGCGLNNRYWVFFAATTDVEFTLRVVDTDTGAVRTYVNGLGHRADAVTDTNGFATCP